MGWREVITQTVWDYTGCTDARAETTCAGIEDRLADMPDPDRIALARELLAGTGRVVARDVGEKLVPGWRQDACLAQGWNECRAAMLKEDGE